MTATPLLFSPFRLRGLELANRVVVSPMCMYMARDGYPEDFHALHYAKFAMGGAGMVIVEATGVTREGRITNGCLGIWDEDHGAALAPVARAIADQGAVPAIQLAHAGRKASVQRAWQGNGPLTAEDLAAGDESWTPVGPSSLAFDEGWLTPQALDRAGMDRIRDAFVAAARRALKAGFRAVELHMAHGYLLQSFLSPIANKRQDDYGGALENRMRFPLEVARAVREALPEDAPLFARISATDWIEGGWEMADSLVLAQALKDLGTDLVDCSSGGNLAGGLMNSTLKRGPGFQAPFAAEIRAETGLSTMAVGLIREPRFAEDLLQDGAADLIALGRQMLFDPFWAHHAAEALGATDAYANWPRPYAWGLKAWDRGLRSMDETPLI